MFFFYFLKQIVAQGSYHKLKNGAPEFEKLIEMGQKVEEEKKKEGAKTEAVVCKI